MNKENRKLVNIMQACELVGVSRRTIYNWMRDGRIEIVKTASGITRIYEDSLWRHAEFKNPSLGGRNSATGIYARTAS